MAVMYKLQTGLDVNVKFTGYVLYLYQLYCDNQCPVLASVTGVTDKVENRQELITKY